MTFSGVPKYNHLAGIVERVPKNTTNKQKTAHQLVNHRIIELTEKKA